MQSYKKLFGEFFKKKRLERNISLRQFCLENGFDAGNTSKMERGLLTPPTSKESLARYAGALGLKEGTDDWREFYDRAAACRGEMPVEILGDEELVQKLPLFFRTLRGEKVPKEKLDEIVALIKRGGS